MRVLVTGGAGFIGSHITANLAEQGHDVWVLDDLSGGYKRNIHPAAHWPGPVDLIDQEQVGHIVRAAEPELVIHCAAYAAEGLSHWMRRYNYTQNLVGWANLANACVEVPKIVALSSMAVYGSQDPPFTEDTLPRPTDPYGAAKAALEADLQALGEVHGTEWLILRPHNVYGPGQNLSDPYRNVAAIFTRQAIEGNPITVYGEGAQTRALSYIGDVASAITTLALETSGEIVNVGGDDPVPIIHLAEMVQEISGTTSQITHLPKRHEVEDAWCRHDKLKRLAGGCSTPLDVGLGKMIDWARSIHPAPKRRYDYETAHNLYSPWK